MPSSYSVKFREPWRTIGLLFAFLRVKRAAVWALHRSVDLIPEE